MRILHICTYYTRSKLYSNILRGLSTSAHSQMVFVPCRSAKEKGRNAEDLPGVKYWYAPILKKWHRVLYHQKINATYRSIETHLQGEKMPDVVHAHCLFSDGGAALKLKQAKGVPYVVAVRGTDVNQFFRKMVHLRPFGVKIMREAKAVVFINKINRDKVFENYIPAKYLQEIAAKSIIIPNGIDAYYHDHQGEPKSLNPGKLNLLYVGNFSPNKNVPLLIESVYSYAQQHPERAVHLSMVGGGGLDGSGDGDEAIQGALEKCKRSNLIIERVGRVEDKAELCSRYRAADVFMMISKRETFGLSYIEALSQGTPIVYTKDQGVSPFFELLEVGAAVEVTSTANVVKGLTDVVKNYKQMSSRGIAASNAFEWNKIVSQYEQLYRN